MTTEEQRLKSCPFCGGPGQLEQHRGIGYWAKCVSAGAERCRVRATTGPHDTARMARQAWNKREREAGS